MELLPHDFQNWLPSRLFEKEGNLFLEWIYLGDVRFDKPFFDETLKQCRMVDSMKGAEQKGKRVTTIDFLSDVASMIDPVNPDLFIFHTSRSGSTLITQILSIDNSNIVFAEYPIVDALIRASINGKIVSEDKRMDWLRCLIKIMGQKRFPEEKRLIIKLDSWHFTFYNIFRKLYPNTTLALLYREPEAILFSNNRQWGMQFIPELVPPETYGIDTHEIKHFSLTEYANKVLQSMYSAIRQISCIDKNVLLLDFKNGILYNIQSIVQLLGLDDAFMKQSEVTNRLQFHSKHPDKLFREKNETGQLLTSGETQQYYNRIALENSKEA